MRETAEDQKAAGAQQIDGLARALHSAADELEPMPAVADYVHRAAEGVDRLSSSLRESSIDDLIGGVMRFARTQPTAFFGASLAVGFALARFFKSSQADPGGGRAAHRSRHEPRHEARAAAPTAAPEVWSAAQGEDRDPHRAGSTYTGARAGPGGSTVSGPAADRAEQAAEQQGSLP
ncbi:MAG: hypothetical protein IRZ09_05190 [Variibacter sp.]|nr:hypothetical protein [Variibacter sp.]